MILKHHRVFTASVSATDSDSETRDPKTRDPETLSNKNLEMEM